MKTLAAAIALFASCCALAQDYDAYYDDYDERDYGWSPVGIVIFGGMRERSSLAFPSPDCTVVGFGFCWLGEQASVYGLELGFIQYARSLHGAQVGCSNGMSGGLGVEVGVINHAETGSGAQIGIANIANGDGAMFQVGIYNGPTILTHDGAGASGVQVGIINCSYRGGHIQIGLLNRADYSNWCIQIGLLCLRDSICTPLIGWHF